MFRKCMRLEGEKKKKPSTSVLGVQEKCKFRQANIYANVLPSAADLCVVSDFILLQENEVIGAKTVRLLFQAIGGVSS